MDLQDGKRMFGDLKAKFGFGGKQDEGYDDYYDEYDEYADDYGDGYDDGYDSYADERPATPRARYESAYASSSTRSSASMPRLVSIDDVRASTQIPSSLNRDPLPPRRTTSASSFGANRTMVDSSLPPSMTPEGTAATAAAASRRHSEGLESLFEPTTADTFDRQETTTRPASEVGASFAYDPFESYSGAASASYSAKRSVTVVKPMNYGEVEKVSRSLKAGDAVVLSLKTTPDDLAKRVLDFSFGVASALDASVDCIGPKVFAITRGKELTELERMSLKNQGVL